MESQNQNLNRLTTLLNKLQSTDKILETSALALGSPQNMTASALSGAVTPQLFTVEDIKPEKIPAGENEEFVCVSPLQWSFQVQINGGPCGL